MNNIIKKELRLSALSIAYWFIGFGLMFMLPGYPVLCGAFFVTLGIYQSFRYAREANDILFSALLPVSKADVVKGKFAFTGIIEVCGFAVMLICVVIRMTVLSGSEVYRENALMNANFFALGMALVLFGVFNMIFLGGFFKTAYDIGKPFIIYIIVCFGIIGAAEAMHYFPRMEVLNAFGLENIGIQVICLAAGIILFAALTWAAFKKSCYRFERVDL